VLEYAACGLQSTGPICISTRENFFRATDQKELEARSKLSLNCGMPEYKHALRTMTDFHIEGQKTK
jgi:hypothetical protein